MPNGRSGSLLLDKTEFANWLSRRDGQEAIGLTLTRAAGRSQAVSVAAVVEMLATFPVDRIAVEEQHGSQYVLHLHHPFDMDPPDTDKWIIIKPESPLFEELRRQHHRQGTWGAGSL